MRETLTFNRRFDADPRVEDKGGGGEKERSEWTPSGRRYVRHVAAVRLSFRHFRVIRLALLPARCSSPERVLLQRSLLLTKRDEGEEGEGEEVFAQGNVDRRERERESQESGTWVFEVRSTRLTGVDQISEDEIIQGRQRSRQSSFRGRTPPPLPSPPSRALTFSLPPPLSLSLQSASASQFPKLSSIPRLSSWKSSL